MANGVISIERILEKLDAHLHKNDYVSAERHLLYWLSESRASSDHRAQMLVLNELMGLYRKLGRKDEALARVSEALACIDELGIAEQVGAATTFLNCATVYKAFGEPSESIRLFGIAEAIYKRELSPDDERFGGLYNNMALTLVDLGRFEEANGAYCRALDVMQRQAGGELEVAITYLNMASAAEARLGLLDADEMINAYLDKAEAILEAFENRDGYYAFVCEKCASVFEYYGRFFYANEISERARRIYAGEGN